MTADPAWDLPLASSEEVAHLNAEHPLPYGSETAIGFDDGCQLTPIHDGCWIYARAEVLP